MKNKKQLFFGFIFSSFIFLGSFLFVFISFSAPDADLDINFEVPMGANYCGNGLVGPGEDCDGTNLDNKSCINVGFACGTLSCNPDCSFNTSDCSLDCPGGGGNDVTPPVISISSLENSLNSSKIYFSATDDSGISSCLFSYSSINGAYSSTTIVYNLENDFWVNLVNLESDTEYFYKITCSDTKLNTSNYYSEFKTLEGIPEKTLVLEVYARPKNRQTTFAFDAFLLFVEKNSKEVFKTEINLDSLGYYKNESIKLPIYDDLDVFIKGRSHLAKKISGIYISDETESLVLNFTDSLDPNTWGSYYLFPGDTQGVWPGLKDNTVNVLDFSAWDVAFEKNINKLDNDLNADGVVNVLDVSIIDVNFNMTGDVYPSFTIEK